MPHEHNCDRFFTKYARELIRFKARALSRRRVFRHYDMKDLQQELCLALLQQIPNFNPDRASVNTFINRVVNTATRMLLREQLRRKRAAGCCARSLDVLVKQDNHVEPFGNTIAESERTRYRQRDWVSDEARYENEEALDSAFESMPPKTVDVCRALMNGSISSAARDLGTSRRQVRNAVAEAREHLEFAGF